MAMDKIILRKQARASRNSMPSELILRKSARIAASFKNRLFPELNAPKCVMIYLSTQSEVKTSGIIRFLTEKGIKIYVPCITDGVIIPVKYTKGCALVKGAFKIKEPVKKIKPLTPKCISLIIIPGIAFDTKGNRVGFGKGFFDSFLSKLPPKTLKVALAFEKQIVRSIPSDSHDIKMDYIITEDRIIKCGASK
jgi:5-formyltetrahydrofolate cyclo-ligase